MKTIRMLPAVVMATLVCGSAASAQLCGATCCVRVFAINGGSSATSMTSPSFRADGSIGELGDVFHASPSFQILAGFVAQRNWLAGGVIVAAMAPDLVVRTTLAPPTPNPTASATRIAFAIAKDEVAALRVYDIAGRQVRLLSENIVGPVSTSLSWDNLDERSRPVAAGVYFVRLESERRTLTQKIVVMR